MTYIKPRGQQEREFWNHVRLRCRYLVNKFKNNVELPYRHSAEKFEATWDYIIDRKCVNWVNFITLFIVESFTNERKNENPAEEYLK